jgi:ubiquitin carboxyl-terminal hydrolase 34
VEPEDVVAAGLIKILHCCMQIDKAIVKNNVFSGYVGVVAPQYAPQYLSADMPSGLARQLFWRHLFPPQRHRRTEPIRRPLLCTRTRERLWEILVALVKRNRMEFEWMLQDLASLVPFEKDEDGMSADLRRIASPRSSPRAEEPYSYDLTPQFERLKAVRSPCGYVGLRNLSNTCYLNSLFTQLFMNTHFREFILGATVKDSIGSQPLLFQTQKLFAFMQGSYQRCVDPVLVVQSIKTYDDTPIDIHNQMDVDEFYNLLFDRFEGQLLTQEERRKFRSFYGGQLVQQVKSKECEHISERLEPFSAIQCDIKGKATLQDSLQAYVEGEVMEGGKYRSYPRDCL